MRSDAYQQRLSSKEWQTLRRRLLYKAGYACQRCGQRYGVLQLHHKTYERLGQERDDDLEVLCIRCHRIADGQRASATAVRGYYARLDGWAAKVYGENWDERIDPDQAAERFDAWLDRREDY